jgi:exo-beta-1,3-glucanase (GH17 family)/cellulose synthase/poly-beta-1,6-N-acetylglucosamine synthase-like glycosyltransferase
VGEVAAIVAQKVGETDSPLPCPRVARTVDAAQHPPAPGRGNALRWASALLIGALVAIINLLLWRAFNPPLTAPDVPSRVAGLAYNGFQRWQSPLSQRFPSDAALADDLQRLAGLTSRLRTYSASELPMLPALAAQAGLRLSAGVWLDSRRSNNEREIAAIIDAVPRHPGIERVIAGNESQLRGVLAPSELYGYLDRLRAALPVPVSTAEPWHVWLRQPALVDHVDFITVHLLPYWEGLPVDMAVDYALQRLSEVRQRFPGKPVVIGEIGWPSHGNRVAAAEATPAAQARFVRAFLERAARLDVDYYLLEAVDQPWKRATEGAVGAHWGLLDAARQAKFAFTGTLQADPFWPGKALVSSALGLLAILPWLITFSPMRLAGRISFALSLQAVLSFAVLLATALLADYLRPRDIVPLALLLPALAMIAAILLVQAFEFAELFWPWSLRHQAALRPLPAGAPAPFVSIHLACCNEPPAMVIATIDRLLALDWPAFEVLVVDNNTGDPALWEPVQAHVNGHRAAAPRAGQTTSSGPGLCFFHLPSWPGYKAGALNVALAQSDPRAEWVAVVDADYLVKPGWLRALAGYFSDPTVAVVQSPQAHRDWAGSHLRRMMNWEYDGFFRIGMHHRQERDAAIQHGTMTLIRAAALRSVGGWDAGSVCEDTELGLRLLRQGLRVVYVDEVLGTGLVPSDFAAYQRQRRRWAQGAMQILRRHRAALLGRSRLRLAQRYHFVAGWLPWLGDALHLAFSVVAIGWTLGVLSAPQVFGLPTPLFVAPLVAFIGLRLLLMPLLYSRRVPCRVADIAGAALAGMALSHSIARGVIAGLAGRRAVFHVTSKGPVDCARDARPGRRPGSLASVREEAALLTGLLACIAAIGVHTAAAGSVPAVWLQVALGMQALPYAAALVCAWLSRADQRR